MRLAGWNEVADGYGPWFEISCAPWWLHLWFHTPVLDKFAYPVAVRRGFGRLAPKLGLPPQDLGDVGPGWQIAPARPGPSVTPYRWISHPGALRSRRRRYVRAVWRHRAGRGLILPARIRRPGRMLLERHNHLFWRIRLPLWAVLGVLGALTAGFPGVMVAVPIALLVELLFS